jgi:hypothetical protein
MLGILSAEGGCSPVGRVGVCGIGLVSSSLMISSGSNSVPGVFLGSFGSGIGVGEASRMVGGFSSRVYKVQYVVFHRAHFCIA